MTPGKRELLLAGKRQDFFTMTTVLSKKGQIVLPSAVRDEMHLEAGQEFEVFIDDEETITLRRINRSPNQGLVDHLLACPHSFEVPPRAKDSTHVSYLETGWSGGQVTERAEG